MSDNSNPDDEGDPKPAAVGDTAEAALTALKSGPAVWAIVSGDRPLGSTGGAIGFGVTSALPPAGPVSLQTVTSESGLILQPPLLWVTQPVKLPTSGDPTFVCQLISYVSYAASAQMALTGTAGAPITVAAIDPTSANQLWVLSPPAPPAASSATSEPEEPADEAKDSPSPPAPPPGFSTTLVNMATKQAISRSNVYPVPGSQMELGPPGSTNPHQSPYIYDFVLVSDG